MVARTHGLKRCILRSLITEKGFSFPENPYSCPTGNSNQVLYISIIFFCIKDALLPVEFSICSVGEGGGGGKSVEISINLFKNTCFSTASSSILGRTS